MTEQMPPEIRKALMILGLTPERVSIQLVLHHWRKQARSTGADDQEAATYLNHAKEILIRWMRENPNRGTRGQGDDPNQPSGVPRRSPPGVGSSSVALPLPEPDSSET